MRLNETLQQYQTKPLSVGQEAPTTVYSKEDMFQKNLNNLLNGIKNNTKNPKNEERLKQILNEIAKTDQGRDIISRLPQGVKLEIASWKDMLMDPHMLITKGTYDCSDKTVSLRPYSFNKINQNSLKQTLIHELRHANQDALHQTNQNIFSLHETFKLSKLREAETHAWFKTNRFCQKHFGSWLNPDKNKITGFMKRDLIAEKKKIWGLLPNPFFNENKVKNSKNYIFQDALKKNNGDLYAAQKALTGVHLKELMNPRVEMKDWYWKNYYDNSSMGKALYFWRKNKEILSNPEEYNKVLDRYQSDYGVKRQDIDKTGLSQEYEEILQKNHERKVAMANKKEMPGPSPIPHLKIACLSQARTNNVEKQQLIQQARNGEHTTTLGGANQFVAHMAQKQHYNR